MNKIVILVATFNGSKYLKEQIDSLINQTMNFDIIIRDDYSKDNTIEIIEDYQSKYEYIKLIKDNEDSKSAKENFSILLEYALELDRYDYFLFCDQDDVWKENKVEVMIERIKTLERESKSPILVHSDLEVVDENLNLINKSFFNYQKLDYKRSSINCLVVQNIVTGCTLLINKELAIKASPFPKEIIMHDWWLGLVASLFGKIEYINDATILYRQHNSNSIGANGFNLYSIIKKVLNIFSINTLSYSIQAKQLLLMFEKEISQEKKTILEEFCSIKSKNKLKRILILIKYRILKKGLIRNLGLILKI